MTPCASGWPCPAGPPRHGLGRRHDLAVSDAGFGPSSDVRVVGVGRFDHERGRRPRSSISRRPPGQVEASLGRLLRHVTGVGLFWFGAPTDGWLVRFFAAAVLAVGSVLGLVVAFLFAGREVSPWWFLLPGWWARGGPRRPGEARRHGYAGPTAPPGRGAPRARRRADRRPDGDHDVGRRVGPRHRRGRGDRAGAGGAALPVGVQRPRRGGGAGTGEGPLRDPGRVGAAPGSRSARSAPRVLRHGSPVGRRRVPHAEGGVGLPARFRPPGDLPLAVAVQCSACLPGAFPPRALDNTGNAAFQLPALRHDRPGFPTAVERLVVNDGGVYDNMADQWEQGYRERAGARARR